MKPIVLVGPRCCGKSSIGKELAVRFGAGFVDADKEFERRYGKISGFVNGHDSIKEGSGWQEFRKEETKVLEIICKLNKDLRVILAPGGGAVAHDQGNEYRERNRALLREFGEVVYLLPYADLVASAGVLEERLQADQASAGSRPSLTANKNPIEEMMTILYKRHPLYSSVAHRIFHTEDRTIEENATALFRLLASSH